MDIRKRVYDVPELGEKCYFIAVPTTSGTGSEARQPSMHYNAMAFLDHVMDACRGPVAVF